MKIQCACGAKYSFEVTPEMARDQIQFICKSCGVDSSAMVNELIRQQFGASPSQPAASQPAPVSRPKVVAVAIKAAPVPEAQPEAPRLCMRHIGELTTHNCLVCQKPICPKCMELFGYVCSAHCKGKTELQGIDIPVYEHQKAVAEARQWRKIGWITTAIVLMVAAVVGVWGWYAWVGSVPKATFSLRFADPGYSGQCRLVPQNQIVFLHGGMLARHDMKAKREIWSHWLIDKKKIAEDAAAAFEEYNAASEKLSPWDRGRSPNMAEITLSMTMAAHAAFELHVQGQNVWVAASDKLIRFDWDTGKPTKEIPLVDMYARLVRKGDEFLLISEKYTGEKLIDHINLASGESRIEEIAAPNPRMVAAIMPSLDKPGAASRARSATNKLGTAGRPVTASANRPGSNQVLTASRSRTTQAGLAPARGGAPGPKPLDPGAIAAKVQNRPMPNRLALPATLAVNANQRRLVAEMRDQPLVAPTLEGMQPDESERFSLVPAPEGFLQVSVKLLESKTIAREAMKAPPQKSALEGTVNAAATAAIANEILNEIQRESVGSVEVEDVSRYQVTLRRPGVKEEWTGEVIGSPQLFPLKTVDVLAGAKSILVLDKTNKKLWESKLNYSVHGSADFDDEARSYGEGPCVERGNTLYVFDEGVLSAFDLTTGNVHWRLPSVGVAGLYFDDQGMLYVNTTTASPERIKYSRQIDVTDKTRNTVLKIDPKTGKTLWSAEAEGFITHMSGKFIYTVQSYAGDDDEDGLLAGTGMTMPAHVRIKRLAASDGRVLWEHYQRRAPLDVQFDKNTIQLLFKKELQFLKFLSL